MRILSKLLRITEDKDMVIHLPLRRIVNQNGKSFIYLYLPWKWINSAAISVFQHWHTTFPQPSDKSGKLKRDTLIQTLPRIICYASNLNAFHTLTLPPSRCVCVCMCLPSLFPFLIWFEFDCSDGSSGAGWISQPSAGSSGKCAGSDGSRTSGDRKENLR